MSMPNQGRLFLVCAIFPLLLVADGGEVREGSSSQSHNFWNKSTRKGASCRLKPRLFRGTNHLRGGGEYVRLTVATEDCSRIEIVQVQSGSTVQELRAQVHFTFGIEANSIRLGTKTVKK
jgi:hypothetical protein